MELKSNAPEIKWIIHNARFNDFAASLDRQLLSRGELSDSQIGAVARILERKHQATVSTVALADTAGVQKMQDAFATAIANRLKRPKMHLFAFTFKLAPATGRNAGAIYVTEKDCYLGKIADGKFVPSRDCSDEQKSRIIELCKDPLESAIAYGKETGICACCNAELTNPESIDRGIGPICAGNFGF